MLHSDDDYYDIDQLEFQDENKEYEQDELNAMDYSSRYTEYRGYVQC